MPNGVVTSHQLILKRDMPGEYTIETAHGTFRIEKFTGGTKDWGATWDGDKQWRVSRETRDECKVAIRQKLVELDRIAAMKVMRVDTFPLWTQPQRARDRTSAELYRVDLPVGAKIVGCEVRDTKALLVSYTHSGGLLTEERHFKVILSGDEWLDHEHEYLFGVYAREVGVSYHLLERKP